MSSEWQDWIGREVELEDEIGPSHVTAMQALLDRDEGLAFGAGLPPLWHWLYFWKTAPQATLGADGVAARGEFLPPIALPRRMWGGSRVSFPMRLPIGATATRRSRIQSITEKDGRSGKLAIVTLRHEISTGGAICVDEEHDIVYREAAKPGETVPAAALPRDDDSEAPAWQREIVPDPILLFRYSALTFNAHRIHYDTPYARDVEGYPALVVHGPLLATLMVDLVRRNAPTARINRFEFRALSPVFVDAPFTVCGAPDEEDGRVALWVTGPAGARAMQGEVELS